MRALAWPSPLVPLPSLTLPEVPGGGGRSARIPSLEERATGGDRGALESLVRQHARPIAELCRCLAGPEDGRDAAQQALEKIVVSIARYDPSKGSFRAWALAVARNTCRDRLRRRGLERRLFMAETDEPMELPGDQPDVERTALARIESVRLAAALETLPAPMRAALVLFHVHESSYEEIAAALEVPLGTVMTWLHRGRKRLRILLEDETVGGAA
jgi:RNA polymerase sigma-70 factor (ECF subfamily)